MQQRNIPAGDGLHHQPSHPVDGKHRFSDHRAGEQAGELNGHHRQYRQHGVAERMAHKYAKRAPAFGTGRIDIVLLQGFQER